ncbi:MAG: NAD(P)/FAD-dependent oxidoreductase [Bacillota bacterium]|nr:NAD(P)/FAD-dependent oxidoreductase [Bacillota bacterium]
MKQIVVIGAGAAGLMAAGVAASRGSRVVLLEKNDRAGKKLRITGKGRCNLTTAVDRDDLIKGFPGNGRFLYSAFHSFSNDDVREFFHARGMETKVERGNRVFPVSDKAEDVVRILRDFVMQNGTNVIYNEAVSQITLHEGKVHAVKSKDKEYRADAVILATGGMSYPTTGSTGDGYRLAERLGHSIVQPRPGLVPLVADEPWVKDLQGLSLKNVKAVSYNDKGKKINEDFGEMLFTHFGISGPIILSMSRDIGDYIYKKQKNVKVMLDLKPALSAEKMDERLQRDFDKYSRKMFKNALQDLLPQKLIPVIITLSGIDPEKECHHITREERHTLGYLLKNFSITISQTRPIKEAIVTAGGVNVKEVDPKTMESRLIQGLYLAGEVMDIDGYTGGFNLQAAFSTGFLAGQYASE